MTEGIKDQRKKGSMGALTEKAFEALMYVSGISGQRELGLEIAKTVRRRLWGKQQLEKLAIAYMNGRRQGPRMASNSLFLGVSEYLAEGLESSIESELGVSLDDTTSSTRISNNNKNDKRDDGIQRIRIRY